MIRGIQIVVSIILCITLDILVGILTTVLSLIVWVDFLQEFKYDSPKTGEESIFWKHTHMYIDSIE